MSLKAISKNESQLWQKKRSNQEKIEMYKEQRLQKEIERLEEQ